MRDIKENKPFEILFNPYDVYKQSFNINPINWVINITQEKPNHVFIAYQTGDEGALATNNGVFNGGRIIEAYLSINAVRIPSFDLQTNFSEEEKNVPELYKMFCSYQKSAEDYPSIAFDRERFRKSYNILHFNLEDVRESLKPGSAQIKIYTKFEGAAVELNAIAIMLPDEIREVKPGSNGMQLIKK